MANEKRANVLMQLGDYCTKHHCKNCFIKKLADENHHGCPEVLRIPEVAQQVSETIKHRRVGERREGA